MSENGKKIAQYINDNKMFDAKQVFTHTVQEKVANIVSDMRKQVAQKLFNHK
jgi:hypothetical protein